MPEHQPLMSSQTSVNIGPDERESTKKALKVAGFTVLACALIAGQALTAYFLLSQKNQINALEDNTNSMKTQMTHRGSAAGGSYAMALPMNRMAMIDEVIKPEEPSVPKSCVQLALEAGPGNTPPQCDEKGNFLPMQCQQDPEFCWCVKADGQMIPGTARPGKAHCGGTARAMARIGAMPSMLMAHKDE